MSRLARLLKSASLAGVVLLLVCAPATAQESSPSPADSPTGWVFRWLNFAIVLALIVYGFRKAAPSFRRNADEIGRRIAEGTRAREAAEQQRRAAQAKLAGVPNEVAALRVEAKRSAEAEADRLKELARTEAEAIERAAQAEIAAAEHAARRELKAYAAELALERAEAQLRRDLTPQAEAVLFGTFVGQLERSLN